MILIKVGLPDNLVVRKGCVCLCSHTRQLLTYSEIFARQTEQATDWL